MHGQGRKPFTAEPRRACPVVERKKPKKEGKTAKNGLFRDEGLFRDDKISMA